MGRKKQYNAEFKAKLALELIGSKKSLVEIGAEYKVPPTSIQEWKIKLIENAKEIFIPEAEKLKQVKQLEHEIVGLHKIIGEIIVENSFFKKN